MITLQVFVYYLLPFFIAAACWFSAGLFIRLLPRPSRRAEPKIDPDQPKEPSTRPTRRRTSSL